MSNTLIIVKNLSYRFTPDTLPAYEGVSFSLNRGELMCLAGTNGSGKSTLLRTLAGLYTPSSGHIGVYSEHSEYSHVAQFSAPPAKKHNTMKQLPQQSKTREHQGGKEGKAVRSEQPQSHKTLREMSALVVQEANMQILGNTVAEDLELTIKKEKQGHASTTPLEEKAHDILSFLNLDQKLHWPVHTLSYGEKRKLCLATAFLRNPALFLLDEPFSGLDYPACLELLAYIKLLLEQGTAIIMSTHDTDLIFDYTHKFLFLSPSKPPFLGTRADAPQHYAAYNLKPLCGNKGK